MDILNALRRFRGTSVYWRTFMLLRLGTPSLLVCDNSLN